MMFRRGGNNKRPRFTLGGHSIFEHDDSSNHSAVGMNDYDEDSLSQQHSSSDHNPFSFGQFLPERPRRAPRPMNKSNHDDNINLNACLDHLLRILSRKDKEGFFQYPVTDQFAPGYSQIITRPMDFSTMRKKIGNDDYSTILEFRSDFELMCENAMKYNRPETIYWQAAKKLLATGSKLMNKEKLISFRRSLECFSRLTERELGFRIDSSSSHTTTADDSSSHLNESMDSSVNDSDNLSSISVSQACSQRKPKLILKLPKFYDKPPVVIPSEEPEVESEDTIISTTFSAEEYSPDEILSQAQQAAQCAREKLHLRHPMISYTLSYQRQSGTSSFRLTNQQDRTQQTINLLEPILVDDSSTNPSAKDFLERGPFSTQASSHHDTPFASIPKEELDLLIHTYGSEFSAQYAVSLMDYVKDAGDLALAYVDRFLSVLTNGEHDNFVMKKREKQKIKEETEVVEPKIEPSIPLPSAPPTTTTITDVPFNESNPSMKFEATDKVELPEQEQNNNNPIPDYVFADLPDLSHLSNGLESIETNLTMINHNDTTFDTFE